MKKIFYIIVLQLLYSTLLVATPLQYDNLQKPIIKKLPLYLVDNNEKKYIKIFYNPMLAINQEHTEEMREFAEYLKKHPIPFFQKEPNMQELNNERSEQCINMAGMYQMKSTNFNEPNEKVVALLKKLRPMKKEERAMYCTRLLIEWIKNQK